MRLRRQQGLSLIELMIAMALGMGVALAALALLNAARSSYVAVSEGALVQDSGRYALDVIARAVRQANYLPHDNPVSLALLALDTARLAPGVNGLDNSRLSSNSDALSAAQSNDANHGSDVLVVRYFGSGTRNKADGSIVNCAGVAIPAPATANVVATVERAEMERSWSIFYVDADSSGEPELRCKFPTHKGGWDSVALARGVEAFQVLYGVADALNGGVTQYRNAAQMSSLQWRQVGAVRVALLVRGEQNGGSDAPDTDYALFGPGYRNSLDPGVTIRDVKQPRRLRKLYQSTIQLRNAAP